MAFVSRIGNVLKQRMSKHMNLELSVSNSSLYQTIRSMSSSKLFVGGLSYGTDETSLREAFSQHGEVVEARIIMDHVSGRSRGFGFVSYSSSDDASRAIQAFDGQDLHGRRIRVNYATDKPRTPRYDGGYGSGGAYGGGNSGYGGGGYGGGNTGYGGGTGGYGGPGGYGSGNYAGGGGIGGYGSGNYGNSNNYGGRDDGFGSSNYASGVGDGNVGNIGAGGGNNYFSSEPTNQGGFAHSGYDGNTSLYGEAQEQSGGNQGETDALGEDFGQDTLDGDYKDDNDEPNDYVNTRG